MHPFPSRQAAFSAALILLARAWRRRVDEAVAPLGLSEATAWALVRIHRSGGGVRQGAVAEALGIEGPSLVRLLDQLCAAGLVERRGDPADRRAKTVSLTDAGTALADKLETVLQGVRRDLLAGVSAADLDACLRVFRIVGRTLGTPTLPDPAMPEQSA